MFDKISDGIRTFMPLIVLAVAALALFAPDTCLWVQTGWINPLLMVVLFGMGLTMNTKDFAVVFTHPRDCIIGIAAQYVIMPLTAFAIGSALAAIAGVLLCSAYPSLSPYTGAMPGIKAFTAAVFGGIGSIPGAMLGGILLGVIEIFGRAYISSELSDAIVFGVLIIVLLVKPTGLLGKTRMEKV
jgi:hypothetical protein